MRQRVDGVRRRARMGRAPAVLLAGVAFGAVCAVGAGGAAAAAPCAQGSVMNIVAHEDDDLLFLGPDVQRDISAGACVRTVYITAGDADRDDTYWQGRETGIMTAYARMAGVANSWATADAGVPGTPILVRTLVGRPNVSLVFMRLPDGVDGDGGATRGFESLRRLQQGTISAIHALDGSATYTGAALVSTLTALMDRYQPKTIRTQDYVGGPYPGTGDHPDHLATATLVRQAQAAYSTPHVMVGYLDNPSKDRPANLSGATLTDKTATFAAYLPFDKMPCGIAMNCTGNQYEAWLARMYTVGFAQTGVNVAQGRVARASSTLGAGFEPGLAVDGNASTRWASTATDGQSWRVDLGTTRTINSVTIDWDAAYASAYRIQVSTDGFTYTTVANVSQATATVKQTTFPAVDARYVRIVGVTRATADGISFAEVSVAGPGADVNAAPAASAGADQSVRPGSAVTLRGGASIDPEGGPLTYAWTQTSGTPVSLSGAGSANPTFTAPTSDAALRFRLVVTDSAGATSTARVAVNVEPENLALNRPATASSFELTGVEPFRANDGALVTRWGAATGNVEWWQVDLGAQRAVDTVDVVWEDAYAATYEVQVSADGVAFTTVATQTAGGPGAVRSSFPTAVGRYVRIRCLTRGTPYTYSIREVGVSRSTGSANSAPIANAGADQSVFTNRTVTLDGSASTDPDLGNLTYRWVQTAGRTVALSSSTAQRPTFTSPGVAGTLTFSLVVSDGTDSSVADTVDVVVTAPVNLALNRPTAASSTQFWGWESYRANDGDLNTRWSSMAFDNQWWQVDLGSVRPVGATEIVWEDAACPSYSIQVSNDAYNFTTAATDGVYWAATRLTTFTPRNARYVRIRCNQRTSFFWGASFWEARVFAG